MSIYEASITNPKKQLEFYKQLSEQLQQENQTLNQKYLNAVADYEQEKFNVEQLKKQVEEERNKVREYSYKLCNLRCEETYENQQKEFIDYMEEKIICYENYQNTNLGEYERNLCFDLYNDILEKYKEIIGVSNENNMGNTK